MLHKFEVKETVESKSETRSRKCVLKISILPEKQLRKVGMTQFHIMRYIENKYVEWESRSGFLQEFEINLDHYVFICLYQYTKNFS